MRLTFSDALIFAMSLLALFNPLGVIAPYIAITRNYSPEIWDKINFRIALIYAITLIGAIWLGLWILLLLGITVPALKTAGALILLLTAVPMVIEDSYSGRMNQSEAEAKVEMKAEVPWQSAIIVPLVFPLTFGGASLAYAIATSSIYKHLFDKIILSLVCIGMAMVIWATYHFAGKIQKNVENLTLITKIAGLLLTALGLQLMAQGVQELIPGLISK